MEAFVVYSRRYNIERFGEVHMNKKEKNAIIEVLNQTSVSY